MHGVLFSDRNLSCSGLVPASALSDKHMEKVKAGLRGLSAAQKVFKAQLVLDNMSGNPHYPNPEPSMAELENALIELREADFGAEDRGRRACLRKSLAVEVMDQFLSRLAAYANSAAQGDATKLLTSGFHLVQRGVELSALEPPGSLASRFVRTSGVVHLVWWKVPGARMYELEIARTNGVEEKVWQRLKLTSKPEHLANGLEPNTTHAFRVRAIGTQAEGPYSQTLEAKSAA